LTENKIEWHKDISGQAGAFSMVSGSQAVDQNCDIDQQL
jgi:hypothetical protein